MKSGESSGTLSFAPGLENKLTKIWCNCISTECGVFIEHEEFSKEYCYYQNETTKAIEGYLAQETLSL